jgi:hypothetical protein
MPRLDLHRLGEERSIAMHRVVAERLLADGGVLTAARERVKSWMESGVVHRAYAEAWWHLLSASPAEIAAALVDTGEEARALRQTSPFAGVLDARTRWQIHREVRRSSE